jgi:hypothetical protein
MVNATTPPFYFWETDALVIVWEAGWAPGPVWTDVDNLGTTEFRSRYRQARSESPHWQHYPDPRRFMQFP